MGIRPITKYHGGKGRIAHRILPFIPDHNVYVEPFGGASSVLMSKIPSEIEVYGEIEPYTFNLMNVCKSQHQSLMDKVSVIDYNKINYLQYRDIYRDKEKMSSLDEADRAAVTYIVRRMSRGGLCGTFSWSKRVYSTGPAEVHSWNSSIQNIPKVSNRLSNVHLENEDALVVIQKYDSVDTFHYVDPPYVSSTRISPNVYIKEYPNARHIQLLRLLNKVQGRVMISGYPSLLYNYLLPGWHIKTLKVANHSSHAKKKESKSETIWMNYDPDQCENSSYNLF